jgi:hypothetical protein
MKDKNSESPLYSKSTAGGFTQLAELITEVHDIFIYKTWSTKKGIELGFYKSNKQTKTSVFFGIWFDAWEHFGIPLSLNIDYKGKAPTEMHQKIKSFIEKKGIAGISYKNYRDLSIILIEESFFDYETDADRLADLVEEVCRFMGIRNPPTIL